MDNPIVLAIVVILILVLVLGIGGYPFGWYTAYPHAPYGVGLVGVLLLIVLVVLLLRR